MDSNPLKTKKAVADEKPKKPRAAFSKGAARTILACKGPPDVPWLTREVEQLCRENCWPMTLLSNDFMTHLGTLFEAHVALDILQTLRQKYKATHPFSETADAEVEEILGDE